jgi:HD-GYP domain-containing protein (c-di-GMP phosphodiesterase class II)
MVAVMDRAADRVRALASRVEAKDPYTDAHTQRVAESAWRVGVRMHLPTADLDALYLGGYIHDIGKIGVPLDILLKPGALDEDERNTMEVHPVVGEKIAAFLACQDAQTVVRHHHERYDGRGYPDGLAGEKIPLLARIVAVCDAYDAMTNDRPYRTRQSREEAMAVLRLGAGRQWDPAIVRVFLAQTA